MTELLTVRVDGHELQVEEGSTVLAAILSAGRTAVRTSVTGQPRGPLCGMGICHECRVMVDGVEHIKSCQALAVDGMEILTDA